MEYKLDPGSDSDRRICDWLVAWDKFERSQDPYRAEVSDFNLPNWKTDKKFSSRSEAAEELIRILGSPKIQSCEATLGKLESFYAVLEDIESGCTTDPRENLFAAMGISLQPITGYEFNRAHIDLQKALDKVGVSFANVQNEIAAISPSIPIEQAGEYVEADLQKARRRVESVTKIPFNFTVKTVAHEVDALYRGRISGVGRDFTIEYNTKWIKNMNLPKLRSTAFHEMAGHGGQYSYVADKVESGAWPLHAGISTMVHAEVIQAEALAMIIPLWLDDGSDPVFSATLALETYDQYVRNNMVIIAHQSGIEAAKEYIKHVAPYQDQRLVDKRLQGLMTDPVDRVYFPVYAPGLRMMNAALKQLSPRDFAEILVDLYTKSLSPADMNDMVHKKGVPARYLLDTRPPEQAERKFDFTAPSNG